ncbi:17055_t:CDS:2 [Cetraspora pellucida]|uniref:17055_t:CDS:1 n=1 Tax=Cetraspora pellucida TaxID=1433469 RepID=A0ACA9N1I9_9GLOM|nr:17055_t:CDS:2 [Cetraspora pellucida]
MSLYTGNANSSFSSFSSRSSKEDYEEHLENFHVHRCWERLNGEVIIYELPSVQHEVVIVPMQCRCLYPMLRFIVLVLLAKADASFRLIKPAITVPNGCDGNDLPWPNLVVEVNVSLRCLYHDLKPPARIPQNLNDPIQLDFYFVQHAIIQAYNIH